METLLKQEYEITSSFNEQMAIESLKEQLGSLIFSKLINEEKYGLKLTFTVELLPEPPKDV
jgi:hypothetical protein